MTRFLSSLAFCSFLLLAGAFLMASSSTAKEDIISQLLALPAPPPPNPLVRNTGLNREWMLDKRNPPKDDAPIEELMEYWRMQSAGYRDLAYNILPSQRSLDRIRVEIEKDPTSVSAYLNIMRDSPEGAEFVKRIYDNWPDSDDNRNEGRSGVKNWLTMNSSYFSGQLAKTANRAADRNEYVSNQDELLALAKYDWDQVRPTVDRLYIDNSQPVSRVLATWALYRHALTEDSMGDTDRYRDELKAFVEDKKATAGMRDLAFDALVKEKDWSGRDDWYYSLLEDETLAELRVNGSLYTGLTTIVVYSAPDKYADKMIELVKSTNPVIRAAAARNLAIILDRERPDVVKALLPWLEDPKWAKDVAGSRQQLVRILQSIKVPESVPGLIAALDEKETVNLPIRDVNANRASNSMANSANAMAYANRAANGANSASNVTRTINVVNHPLRSEAIGALGTQGDMRAAPVLRRILREVEGYERNGLVKAILLCKGFTVIEQADALESLAKNVRERQANAMATAANAMNAAANAMAEAMADATELRGERYTLSNSVSNAMRSVSPFNPDELKEMLGMQLLQIEEPGDPLVRELVARISLLEKSDPTTAETLRSLLLNWKGAAINSLLLKDLKDNKASAAGVLKLLSVRKDLREKQSGDVYDIRRANPTAAGIAACLLEAESDYAAILAGDNAEAKAAMLACARLIRAKLPIHEAAKYLANKDKRLANAAELYLESEDSPEARSIVLSLHPDEARILGATTAFWPEKVSGETTPLIIGLFASVSDAFAGGTNIYSFYSFGDFKDVEKRLQNEIKEDGELLGIYSYTDNFIRIYKDKAVYSWEEDQSRYRERTLAKEEFDNFKGYMAYHKVDELTPFLACGSECEPKQLLMLGRQGGRRVFVNSSRDPEFFAGLEAMFKEMRAAPAKLRYTMEKDVPGLEILFADENQSAKTVWKNGGDIRLLIADKVRRKEINREIVEAGEALEESETGEEAESSAEEKVWELQRKREFDNYAWFKFDGGRLVDSAVQPEQAEFLPVRDNFAVQPPIGHWKARAAGIEIRGNSDGLHKIAGGKITKIRSGHYNSPVITANGRWAIVTKFNEDEGPELVRVNLLTNKEFPVISEDYPARRAVAFVPSVNRVLTTDIDYNEYEDYEGDAHTSDRAYYWLDADTGMIVPATGEIQPLGQQKFRSLQPAQNAFEFWAAIHNRKKNETNVGVYNAKTFTFKPMLTVPKIEFDSMDMWVDLPTGKVYFAYSGHLLALPLAPVRGK